MHSVHSPESPFLNNVVEQLCCVLLGMCRPCQRSQHRPRAQIVTVCQLSPITRNLRGPDGKKVCVQFNLASLPPCFGVTVVDLVLAGPGLDVLGVAGACPAVDEDSIDRRVVHGLEKP